MGGQPSSCFSSPSGPGLLKQLSLNHRAPPSLVGTLRRQDCRRGDLVQGRVNIVPARRHGLGPVGISGPEQRIGGRDGHRHVVSTPVLKPLLRDVKRWPGSPACNLWHPKGLCCCAVRASNCRLHCCRVPVRCHQPSPPPMLTTMTSRWLTPDAASVCACWRYWGRFRF